MQKSLCVGFLLLMGTGCDASPSAREIETKGPDGALRPELSTLSLDVRRQRVDRFRASLGTRLSRSSAGLSHHRVRPGEVITPLEGRFGHAMLARRGPSGELQYGCFDEAHAAARFLDPELAGGAK